MNRQAIRSEGGGAPFSASFEVFPPKSDVQDEALCGTVERLRLLSPRFVSVTYGAGGTTRERSLATVRRMVREGLPTAAHLTCVSAPREAVDAVARTFRDMGVRHIVALRGDPSEGVGRAYRPHPGGYPYAADLIAGLKRIAPFEVSVSAYPERHPESRDWTAEIDNLKRKADAGAARAITQFFFDNDVFDAFRERVAAAGLAIPIVPGLMPIQRFEAVRGFAGRCGATIPQWLADCLGPLGDDPEAHREAAAEIAANQVADLCRRGVGEVHFYTMNAAGLIERIYKLLGIGAAPARAAA
jgi:methylenetetrahydrofolate reductase (NADPH)